MARVYEFLRNNALDAPNYFDQGSAPPFQRNQFGGAVGGPIQKDKTFFFANYEGFSQNLHQTSVAFVPDLASRAAAVPSVQPLLNLWLTPPAERSRLQRHRAGFSSPLQTIRENFGTARLDHIFSSKDTFSAIYTIDDGTRLHADDGQSVQHRHSESCASRSRALEETHVFSPTLLNTARFGYSRAGYFFTGEPTPGTPAASVPGFLLGRSGGRGGGGRKRGVESAGADRPGGKQQRQQSDIARNLYTYEDRVSWTHGAHQFSFGAWFQQFQSNETIALSQYGQATFTSLQTFLTGTTSTLPVRSRADGDELALAVRRGLCAGRDSPEPEADAEPGLPRRILHRME